MTNRITVAVSGINAVDNPGPGTGIIRSLKESGLNVRTIGLAYDSLEPGIFMDKIIDKSYLMPYPSCPRESFLERIKYIHSQENLDVIISALDAELPMFMDLEKEIESLGIKMLIPTKEMFQLRDKTQLSILADEIGVKAPEYKVCTSFEDLFEATEKMGFPVMVKGPFYEAFKASSIIEAERYFRKISNKWGFPIIVQKFIIGEEYDVVGCGDGMGNDLGLFSIKKMSKTQLGKVWNAISIHNEKLLEVTRNMVKKLKWRGGFEFEILIEQKTQTIYLLEINPRFPAWVYMASACGVNLPYRMVNFLLNNKLETSSDYQSGKIMIRYTTELIKDISDFEKITVNAELANN